MSTVQLAAAGGDESPFDSIRQTGPDGAEFWSARDLMPLLGYAQWRQFNDAVQRATAAAENSGASPSDHFADARKVILAGKGARQEVADYRLTRYGAYLAAMNSDPRKPPVAAAQTYFAVKTREAEIETMPAPVDELEFAERYVASIKARRELEAQVAVLGPKAEAFDEGQSHAGLMTITDFAKKFDYPPRKIFDHLKTHDWIFKNQRGEHREHVDHEAHFEVRDTGRTYADGVAAQQIYLNPVGEEALRRWLKQHPVPGTKRQPAGELIPFPTDGAE